MDVGHPHIQDTYHSSRGLQEKQGDDLENVTTPDQYEILEMNRISGFVDRARGLGRPTKKDRRELEQFTDLGMMNDGFDFEFDFEDPEDEE